MEEAIPGAEPVESKNKAPRIRSVSYPAYTIQACFEFVAKIDKTFTDVVYTSREDISKHMQTSGGAFLMQLSSSVQYNLLELKSKDGYKPTPLYKKIKRPLPDERISDFFLECLQNPELYKKLLSDFNDKQLPSLTGLANILDRRYSVKGNASEIAAKIFLRNLESLQLIGEDNILKIDGYLTPIEDITAEQPEIIPLNQTQTTPVLLLNPPQTTAMGKNVEPKEDVKEIPIFLKGGREAKILLPLDFTDEDIVKVSKVLSGYLP